ncbi:MAG: GNAT family N-acetyltransferase [Bacillota bacterium]|jgi:ribosomal protein S18 acetylase RimI-like enzyme
MNITIRLAAYADAQDMANILSRSWEVAYKDILPAKYIKEISATRTAMWERNLSAKNNIHYIILNENTSVGIMTVGPPRHEEIEIKNDTGIDDSFWELHGIYLHPDYFRRGIGTIALEFAMDKARAAGKENILLWVFEENLYSIKFYNKCGFSPDGTSKVYNCGKEMNCIRMRKSL